MTTKPTSETEIFQAAANLPAEERGPFLDRACGDNQPLRREIESLLKAHDPDGSFLQSPALAATLNQPKVNQTLDEQPGSMIGPYKIREKIGEGGFGVVYVAEQEQPVRRKVALKVIKPGMDSREIVARFEAERQALALMDHPHIAKILDASTTASGRPYFVMELVRGVLITDYCNAQKLPTKQRLELFIQVCHAVQHAHQKGVVHRDLKPSNVLVAPHDGVPVVKVIDFGVAKALGQQLTDKSIYTRFASMIGTPLYMSPEQAEINALDIDTRSDVYSLGVLLYELLTGTTPFDRKKLESAAFDEMRRIIREEMPESPSARVTTLTHESKAIAASYGVDSGNLAKIIRGDLDVIVMKALEKERGRRYDTASAFAEDIGRYLNQEPILAKPASTAYRFKKFAQRNRGAMLTGSLIAVSLLLATVVSTLSAIAAGRSRNEALASAAEAIESRSQAERSAQEARAAQQAESQRAEEARHAKLEAEARQAEASATLNFLTNKLLANSDPGINFLDKRSFTSKQTRDSGPGGIDFDSIAFAAPVLDAGVDAQNPTVLELLDRAAAELSEERIELSFPKQPNVQCAVLHTIAQCYRRLDRTDKALPYAERAAQVAEQLYGLNDVRTIRELILLARSNNGKGQVDKAKSIATQALEISTAQFGENHEVTWVCMGALAGCYKVNRHQDLEFLSLHRKILSYLQGADLARLSSHEILNDSYPQGWAEFLAIVLTEEAKIQVRKGSHEQANALAERAHAIISPGDGVETPASLKFLGRLAEIKLLSGDLQGATKTRESSFASLVKIYGEEHPLVSENRRLLAWTFYKMRDYSRAMRLGEEQAEIDKKLGKHNDPNTLKNLFAVANVRLSSKKYASAISLMEDIRPRVEQTFANDKRMLTSFLTPMSYALEKSGRLDEAIAVYEQCYAMGTENLVYDAMSAHDRMIALYLDTDQLERALAIVPAVLKTSRDQGVQTELKWLKRVADKLLKHSQVEAVIPVLEEVLRREEAVQNDGAEVKSSTASADWTIAVGKSREQLLDAYLTTNRLEDAKSRLSSWLASEEKPDVRLLQAGLRISNSLMKSRSSDDTTEVLATLEQATRKGVTSQGEGLLQRMSLANDVRQLALYGDIARQYLDLGDFSNAERLSRVCVTQYTRLEQSGRFILPIHTKQAQYILGCALLEQGKYSEAEPMLLASLLSEEELSDGADSTAHKAAIAALEKLYIATDRPELAKKWRAKP